MNVFDRQAKKIQRDHTALQENYQVFNYLKDEVLLYRMHTTFYQFMLTIILN